jgi:hypothetical protein
VVTQFLYDQFSPGYKETVEDMYRCVEDMFRCVEDMYRCLEDMCRCAETRIGA